MCVKFIQFFFLLGSLSSGLFAKSSDGRVQSLPSNPSLDLHESQPNPSLHRKVYPDTDAETLDTTQMPQRDVTTPIATVPIFNPITPTTTTPIYNPLPTPGMTPVTNPATDPATNPYTTPVTNPVTNPYTTPGTTPGTNPYTTPATNPYTAPVTNPATNPYTTPVTNPNTTPATNPATNPNSTPTSTTPSSSGQSWCVANPSASETALQVALDYACGYGGADCSGIQQGGSCFNPNTVRDHASFAFNSYYQKNPTPTSCDFGGTAILTNTDPSTSSCQYPSSSTSSSTLNTTNPTGSTVFGSSPPDYTDSNSSSISMPSSFTLICLLISLIYFKV